METDLVGFLTWLTFWLITRGYSHNQLATIHRNT
uniref:Uncharacterized protein n=1 Tax=Anguilla anguilla TaxID=7936 RepID=A0A0E9U639_ANGAN